MIGRTRGKKTKEGPCFWLQARFRHLVKWRCCRRPMACSCPQCGRGGRQAVSTSLLKGRARTLAPPPFKAARAPKLAPTCRSRRPHHASHPMASYPASTVLIQIKDFPQWTPGGTTFDFKGVHCLTPFQTRFLCTGVQNWTLNRLNPVRPWRSGFIKTHPSTFFTCAVPM